MIDIDLQITRKLKVDLEISLEGLEAIVRDYAVEHINAQLEEQGHDLRIVQADVKIELLANSYGDVQGAQASVDKEIE